MALLQAQAAVSRCHCLAKYKTVGAARRSRPYGPQKHSDSAERPGTLTIPEPEHAKAAALGTLVSMHSCRTYKNAIDKFICWYCSEPRL